MKKLKVVFMGTPDFSTPILETIFKNHEVVSVYCQPPRPSGRGQKVVSSSVQKKAEELGIMVNSPLNFKSEEERQKLAEYQADIAIISAYGMILPEAVINIFPKGCINVHASLLPRWRGASPIQSAIMAGDGQSGISIMKIVKALDAGDVMLTEEVVITDNETAGSLHDKLSAKGAEAIIKALDLIINNRAVFVPQNEKAVTFSAKISKESAKIDFSQKAEDIERQIRAYNPWPGAWFSLNGERIKVNLARVVSNNWGAEAGKIIDKNLTIACGESALEVLELQRAGKAAMSKEEFLRGMKNLPDKVD